MCGQGHTRSNILKYLRVAIRLLSSDTGGSEYGPAMLEPEPAKDPAVKSSMWTAHFSSGSASEFHRRPLSPDPLSPMVWIHRIERPAFVLGSAQSLDLLVHPYPLDIEICQRRSGGGMVYIDPESSCWIDIILPRGHSQWHDDISKAFHWVGELWAATLADLGVAGCQVHKGPAKEPEHGRALCFAGLGAGEVTIDDRKVVGLSQRRVRSGARFQCLVLGRWDSKPFTRFDQPSHWPPGLRLDQVMAGHRSITDSLLAGLPKALITNINQIC